MLGQAERTGSMAKLTGSTAGIALIILALAVPAAANGDAGGGFRLLSVERDLLGSAASRTWQGGHAYDQIGGDGLARDQVEDEVGGSAAPEDEAEGPSNTGDKIKAGALSAVLPGAGQFYNDDKPKAYIMAGVEVAIWTTYFIFDQQGDNAVKDARDYARIFAGAGGTDADYYWRAVGRYTTSDEYNEDLARQRRSTTDPVPDDIPDAWDWLWSSTQRQGDYLRQMDDADAAYKRRDFMILFAVVNRVVSVVDAVLGAGSKPGAIETEVLGMDLGVEMVPSWRDPGARCVVSRSF
jgi:hypothetical protein